MTATTLPTKIAHADKSLDASASPWRGLYRVGAAAALGLVLLTIIQAAVFIMWPPPSFAPNAGAVADWFAMLQGNWLIGLLNLDLVMLVDYPLSLLVFLALYIVLFRTGRSLTTVAAALGFTGIVSYFAVNPAFTMLNLANEYGAAATEAERSMLLSAGQGTLAAFEGSGFISSYILIALGGLLMAIAMLRANTFGKVTAWMGILFYGMNLVPASAGTLGLVLSLASLIPMLAWLILVARRLLALADATADRRPEDDASV